MNLLIVLVVGVVLGCLLAGLLLWWDARLRRDHGEVSATWRDQHGRDKGKGGS